MKKQNLLTRTKYFGQTAQSDIQGRILILAVLRKTLKIKGEVEVLDGENYLEVWNHTRLANNLKRAPITLREENTLDRLAG
jgi:DNA-binding transcriptional regulator/RsmH inhibitor MraZ